MSYTKETPKADRQYKAKGAVYTPRPIASLLAKWAVQEPSDCVLDLGSGEGIFIREAVERLSDLGAASSQALDQVFGAEYDSHAYEKLHHKLSQSLGAMPPNVSLADFFELAFPKMEAVVGNPPYVRRWWQDNIEKIRSKFKNTDVAFTRLTDLACYFIAYAGRYLKPAGRLAVILSDSWLNMDYGVAFKRYLLKHYNLRAIIGFRPNVFPDILVRSVIVLADKKASVGFQTQDDHSTRFLMAAAIPTLDQLEQSLSDASDQKALWVTNSMDRQQSALDPRDSWGNYLYAPRVYFELRSHPLLTPLGNLAVSRIGFQSFAKQFYVLPAERSREIEPEYLKPVIISSRDVDGPIITKNAPPDNHLLYCDKSKTALANTKVLRYIEDWESRELKPRGKAAKVKGIHNLPRLKRTNRDPWYNLMPELNRRGTFPILLFRRVHRRYMAIWNKAGWIASENFIELKPHADIDLKALLGFLNSSYAEFFLKCYAHRYGGGVLNLNPGAVRTVPVLDLRRLANDHVGALANAYDGFVQRPYGSREELNRIINTVLGVTQSDYQELQSNLNTAFRMEFVTYKDET